MNFAYLAHKYLHVDCLMENRTYDGLLWPPSAGEKPSYELFEAFQREEDREARLTRDAQARLEEERRTVHRQARAKALEDITPFADKIAAEHAEIRAQALQQKAEAIELQHALDSRSQIELTWREIAAAEDRISKEAQQYLDDTAHMLSWDTHRIPADVLAKREEAHNRINHGKTVYGNWNQLRALELPSREDLAAAIRAGGDELARIRKICQDVALKYPKPKKTHY
jgi:hypothetical protein